MNLLREVGLHEEKGASEVVGALRRSRDGESLPKQTNLRDEDRRRASMKIDNLLSSKENGQNGGKKRTRKAKEKKKSGGAVALVGEVEQYGIVSEIAQANDGISLGQLLKGDAKDAVVMARKLFANKNVKSVMFAITEKDNHQNNQKIDAVSGCEDEPKKLELAEVQVFRSSVMILFDSGAVREVMSLRLCDRLHVVSNEARRRITTVDSREAVVVGEVSRVPVTNGESTAEISCLVVRLSPCELITGRPTMKKMRASLDFDGIIATFRHGGEVTSDDSDGVSSEES